MLRGSYRLCLGREVSGVRKHARKRAQQRGVAPGDVDLALRYGVKCSWFQGAMLYYLGRRGLDRALKDHPEMRPRADRLVGLAVVVDLRSRKVATVFKHRGGIQDIRRAYRGRYNRKAWRRVKERARWPGHDGGMN